MAIKHLPDIQLHLFICNGSSCKRCGAEKSTDIIRSNIKKMGCSTEIHTSKTLCNGRCDDAPVVICMPEGIWYKEISPEFAKEFTERLLLDMQIPDKHHLYRYGETEVNSISPLL